MIDRLLSIIAPHHCYGCGEYGTVLCDCCKNYIYDESFSQCIVCGTALSGQTNLCPKHQLPYSRLWCITRREGTIEKLIDAYKFQRVVAAAGILAEILDEQLPELPADTVIVPIPTTPHNIRLRGYDHMLKIAKILAKKRGWRVGGLLSRNSNVTQHFAKTAAERRHQAKDFFKIRQLPEPEAPYLLLDDIFTTGSTIEAAADCLRRAGVNDVAVAIIARQ